MITDQWREEVLGLASQYCEATGTKLSILANRIVKDADYFDNLKNGRGCTADTLAKVVSWLQENTPKKPKRRSK